MLAVHLAPQNANLIQRKHRNTRMEGIWQSKFFAAQID